MLYPEKGITGKGDPLVHWEHLLFKDKKKKRKHLRTAWYARKKANLAKQQSKIGYKRKHIESVIMGTEL